MSSSGEPEFEVVWPKSPLAVEMKAPAPRLKTLQGKRVAFLWDYLFRGPELFPVIAQDLQARFSGMEFVGYEEFGNTHGADEAAVIAALPERLADKSIDAVISGVGC